jgi:hypothetical protein
MGQEVREAYTRNADRSLLSILIALTVGLLSGIFCYVTWGLAAGVAGFWAGAIVACIVCIAVFMPR